MDPYETLMLFLLALAKNARAEAQDHADSLADWLSRDGFNPVVNEEFLANFRHRLYDGTTNPPANCVLVHTHQYGMSVYPFTFIPNASNPSPLIRSIAEQLLESDFEPSKGETLLIEILSPAVPRIFRAGDGFGGEEADFFCGEEADEIIVEGDPADGEEESNEDDGD